MPSVSTPPLTQVKDYEFAELQKVDDGMPTGLCGRVPDDRNRKTVPLDRVPASTTGRLRTTDLQL